ncbi:spermatogenesis associated 2-like [Megalops cyprinoides]|uniref:spermatogenesis associated 2-like n=1 Tax=Megalops cyprinoides TaxID=118141 RepID=UPI001863D1B2|nr:spermatogenesis associated 2-like [Megalops cyprinoides]
MNTLGRPSSGGVCEDYRVSLERRVVQGDGDLVCQDAALCEVLERLLREGDAQNVHAPLGLQPLAVMEASLQAPPSWGHSTGGLASPTMSPGLGMLAKAFEVLERAALNLYLCPWRKEYRVIKMFSGMFTHLIRPAFSKQQVDNLFGLLGYRITGEELELLAPLLPPATLLGFACAFFAARCECQMLSSAAATLGGGVLVERHLVEERQKGHSLRRALENLQGKVEVTRRGYREDKMSPLEGDLDLYTAEGQACNGERGAEGLAETSIVSYYKENSNKFCSDSFQAAGGSSTATQKKGVCVSILNYELTGTSSAGSGASRESAEHPRGAGGLRNDSKISGDARAGMSQGQSQLCHCFNTSALFNYKCEQCQMIHTDCHILERCRMAGHSTCLVSDTDPHEREGKASTTLQDGASFLEKTKSGKSNVSLPGASSCFTSTSLPAGASHRPEPFTLHKCAFALSALSELACHTCRVFHSLDCHDGRLCQKRHEVNRLGGCTAKQGCRNTPQILCWYCGTECCKDCWYRDPLYCVCGQPRPISSEV